MFEHIRYHFQSSQQPYRVGFPILILHQSFPACYYGIWGCIILCGEDCPVNCRMVSGIPGHYRRDASSTPPPVVLTKNVSQHGQLSPGGQ